LVRDVTKEQIRAAVEKALTHLDPRPRSCNRHDDCDAADAAATLKGRQTPDHCHTDDCEDCFGT
jgi:hypothetical protein